MVNAVESAVIPIMALIAVIVIGITILTGGMQSLVNDIASAYLAIIGFIIGVSLLAFAYIYFKTEEEEKKNIRYKVLIGSVITAAVIMIIFLNLPGIVNATSSAVGMTTHVSTLKFPVTVTSPASFGLLAGVQIYISSVGQPQVIPNKFTFSIFPLGLLSNTVIVHATTTCNGTIVGSGSASFTLSTVSLSEPTQTNYVSINNVPDSGQCITKFTLTGPSVNTGEVWSYYSDISANYYQDGGFTT
jgi:hypothetical protein